MRIAIIGAGFAGIASARVLAELGHDVTVFESAPDIGGIWSRTRRYPGLRTQNNKGTYHLSELPFGSEVSQWPTGEQVQEYLEQYVDAFGLRPKIRLSTPVEHAEPDAEGWSLTIAGQSLPEHFDHLVVANGIFSVPSVPEFPGADDLRAASGRIVATPDFHDLAEAAGKNVVVVGYGKSAHDVAVEIAKVAATTTVVARNLLWKVPRFIKNKLNYKYLLLTRLGEGLFKYQRPVGFEKFLHGSGVGVRNAMVDSVQSVTTKQLRLEELGLVPEGKFEDIAKASVSLASEGFFEAVEAGVITVHRDAVITQFVVQDGRPFAELSDGALVPADLVVCGTGALQVVPFFSEDLQARLHDEKGNFALYRYILPHDVPNLTFAGYNSSFFSPLSAEMAAVWIGSYLGGGHTVPPIEVRRRQVSERLAWMEERTHGVHARGTNLVPFSLHNIDEVLDEVGLNVRKGTRFAQWLAPVNPRSYRRVLPKLRKRLQAIQSAPWGAPGPQDDIDLAQGRGASSAANPPIALDAATHRRSGS